MRLDPYRLFIPNTGRVGSCRLARVVAVGRGLWLGIVTKGKEGRRLEGDSRRGGPHYEWSVFQDVFKDF